MSDLLSENPPCPMCGGHLQSPFDAYDMYRCKGCGARIQGWWSSVDVRTPSHMHDFIRTSRCRVCGEPFSDGRG